MKWMVLFFVILELIVTISLAGKIGGFNTFVAIILTGVVGVVIMMNFKKVFMNSLVAVMSRQLSAQDVLTGNFLSLIGAVLLVIPGFLTDFIGLLLQLGFIKNVLTARVKKPQQQEKNYTHKGDDDVIDVEIIEHDTTSK
jgi:2-isopropylmalate synthase/UPF0716 protein FxsA